MEIFKEEEAGLNTHEIQKLLQNYSHLEVIRGHSQNTNLHSPVSGWYFVREYLCSLNPSTVFRCMCCAVWDSDLLYSWLFTVKVVNKNSLNYCSSSDKSKRRTKTVKKSLEPKWNQTFMYSPVHRREFRERMLEITLWDQARVREEESEFLGEVRN